MRQDHAFCRTCDRSTARHREGLDEPNVWATMMAFGALLAPVTCGASLVAAIGFATMHAMDPGKCSVCGTRYGGVTDTAEGARQ